MNISQALKRKNQLAGEVKKLGVRMSSSNSYTEQNPAKYNSKEVMNQWYNKKNELIELKSLIDRASLPIRGHIYEINEIKDSLALLKYMSVRDEEIIYGGETPNVKYNAVIPELERDEEVERLEARIISLQDQIDSFNATTNVI